MACMGMTREGETLAERMTRAKRALKSLEQKLTSGAVKIAIAPNGAIAFKGWVADREDLSDVCAFRALSAESSWVLRQAVARAEAMSCGCKVNLAAVAAGVHSHDGGSTWHRGH